MPLQNRVTPFSAVEAVPDRGLFTGNRGCLHDDNRRLVTQGWRTHAWIVCTLTYKDVRRVPMTPRRWTELFFLDEATALAAGHRPCAYCRRPAFRAFVEAWASVTGGPARAPAVDAALHADRVPPRRGHPRPTAVLGDLPDGTFVTLPDDAGTAWLAAGGKLWQWSHAGYASPVRRSPRLGVTVLTPAATVTALRAGYRPVLHPTVAERRPNGERAATAGRGSLGFAGTLSHMSAVSPASPAELEAAVRVLVARRPSVSADKLLGLFAAGECSPDGLLVARAAGGTPAGAVLVQLQPGSAASVHPPGAADPAVADGLAAAAVAHLRAAGVRQAQCVVQAPDVPLVAPLERAGFRAVTRLVFFAHKLDKSARVGPNPEAGPLRFEPVADPAAGFAAALMASYDGTLDCPELNDVRSADDILAGYRAMAAPDPPDWTLLRLGADPAGVLILGAGPKPGFAELTYVGLVPSARGRGFGTLAVRAALRRATAAGNGWLTLSVDERNAPALKVYRRLGFREFDVQHVYLWQPAG